MDPNTSADSTFIASFSDAIYWTDARKELSVWLNRNRPSLAELYIGAVELLYGSPLPGRVRFISHAVREIRNRLPDVIAGPEKKTNLIYKDRLDVIVKMWKDRGFSVDGSIPKVGSKTEIDIKTLPEIGLPLDLFQKISKLVSDHEMTRSVPLEAAIRLFETLAPENIPLRDTLRPVVTHWILVTGWFEHNVHDSGKRDAEYDLKELISQFELFETCLGSFIRGFFSTIEELDEILEEANN